MNLKSWVVGPLYGVFTLHDAETDTETDKKWVVQDCVEEFTLQRGKKTTQIPIGF